MRGDLQIDAVQQDGSTLAAVIFLNQGCTFSKDHNCVQCYDDP